MKFLKGFTFLLVILQSCSLDRDTSEITDSYTVGETKLDLVKENDSTAFLNITREGIVTQNKLKIKPPCYFLRKGGKVQDYSFLGVEAQHVLIVAGTMATKDRKKKFSLKNEEVCGSEAQGIVFEYEKVKVTEKVFSGNVYCKDLGVDNLYFWNASHN
ncbi:MAG: hypothetical protein H7329_16555 [Opitutaceae bacterium]|nr:hypothetical protein [Cytophagales bacterium]